MSQHLVSTKPSRSHCHLCGRPTLCGLDTGVSYTVDLVPLTVAGELTARLQERSTYRLEAGFVMYRGLSDIRATATAPVLATHSCTPINLEHIDQTQVAAVSRYLVPHDVVDPDVLFQMGSDDVFTPDNADPPF